jgi:hypothetical protein
VSELAPCERATFVHFLIGGAEDGKRYPSGHCYDTFRTNGHEYVRDGEAERDNEMRGMEVINCTDDYMEPVFYRVTMRPAKGTPNV